MPAARGNIDRVESRLSPRTSLIALSVITLAALAIRIMGLTAESLWLDEIVSVRFVLERSPIEVVRDTFQRDYHPFAYYLLLDLWTTLFGAGDAAVRMLSATLGAGSVLIVHMLALAVFRDRTAALIAAGLTAVAPMPVWYSQECRMYIFLIFTWGLTLHALVRGLGSGLRGRDVAYLVLSFGLFAYGHGTSGFLVLPFLLGAILIGRTGRGSGSIGFRRRAAVAGLCGLVHVPWMIRAMTLEGEPKALEGLRLTDSLGVFQWLLFYVHLPDRPWIVLLWIVLAGLIVVFSLTPWKREWAASPGFVLASLVIPLVTIVILTGWKPIYQARNLCFLVVPAILIVAGGLRAIGSWGRGLIAIAAGAFLFTIMVNGTRHDLRTAGQKESWREVSRLLVAGVAENDVLVFHAGYTRACFDHYYLGPGGSLHPPGDESPPGRVVVSIADLPENRARPFEELHTELKAVEGASRVWVVFSHGEADEVVDGQIVKEGFVGSREHRGKGIEVRTYRRPTGAADANPTGRGTGAIDPQLGSGVGSPVGYVSSATQRSSTPSTGNRRRGKRGR